MIALRTTEVHVAIGLILRTNAAYIQVALKGQFLYVRRFSSRTTIDDDDDDDD